MGVRLSVGVGPVGVIVAVPLGVEVRVGVSVWGAVGEAPGEGEAPDEGVTVNVSGMGEIVNVVVDVDASAGVDVGVDVSAGLAVDVPVAVSEGETVSVGDGASVAVSVEEMMAIGRMVGLAAGIDGRGIYVGLGVALGGKIIAANLRGLLPTAQIPNKITIRARTSGQRRPFRACPAADGDGGVTLRVTLRVFPVTISAGMGGRGSIISGTGLVLNNAFSIASIKAAPVW